MPGTFVSSDSFTAGPPVTRSSVTSAPSESSFSGRRPTESRSVSHGIYFSEPGTRLAVGADLGERDALEPLPAVDIHNGVAQKERIS